MGSESPSVDTERISNLDEDDDALDEVGGIFEHLNFKVVPRQPGDVDYRPASYLPSEEKAYAVEFLRMKGEIERLRKELESKCNCEHQDDLKKADEKVKEIVKQVEAVEKLFEMEKEKSTSLEDKLEDVEKMREEHRAELEKQKGDFAEIKMQLESANERIQNLEKGEADYEKIRRDLEGKLEALSEQLQTRTAEKEQLQNTISERDKEVKEFSELILEQRRLVKEAEKKLVKQENLFQQIQEQKLRLETELQSKNQDQETLANLQIQLERQVEKCSRFRSELRKTKEIVDAKEQKLVEAEGIIIDQQKVITEGEELKKQLERIVHINLKLDEKVSNLEGGIRERQAEIERLERSLSHERQEHSKAEVRFRRLREHVFNFNTEFSVFVEDAKNCVGEGQPGGDLDDSSLPGKLDLFAANVQSKFRVWTDNQKVMEEQLAKTKKTVVALSQLLESRPVPAAVEAPPTEVVADPGNPSLNPPNVTVNHRDITRLITYCEATDDLRAEVFSTMIRPPDPTEECNLTSPQEPVAPSRAKKHGVDKTKLESGWYCVCGEENFETEENLRTHLNYILSKHQYKCFICSERFQFMKSLKSHLWDRHDVVINPIKRSCMKCGRKFPTWEKLCQHKKTVHTVQRASKFLHRKLQKTRNLRTSKVAARTRIQKSKTTLSANETNDVEESVPQEISNEITISSQEAAPTTPIDFQDSPIPPATPSATDSPPNSPLPLENEMEVDMEETASPEASSLVPPEPTPSPRRKKKSKRPSKATPPPSTSEAGTATHAIDHSKSRLGSYCTCGKKLSTKENLNWHIQYFTQEWRFRCEECGSKQYCFVYLKRHYADSHKMPNYLKDFCVGCSDCGIMFKERRTYLEHRRTVHGLIPWKKREDSTHSTSRVSPKKSNPVASTSNLHVSLDMTPSTSRVAPKKSNPGTSTATLPLSLDRTPSTSRVSPKKSNPGTSTANLPVSLADIKNDPDGPSQQTTRAKEHAVDRSIARRGGHYCICGQRSKSKSKLQAHINYKNAEEKFFCSECQKGFIGTNYLRRHMLVAHNMKFHFKGCRKCGAYFETNKLLRKHMKEKHKVKRVKIVHIDLTDLKDSEEEAENKEDSSAVESDDEEEEEEETSQSGKVKHSKAGKLSCTCGSKFSTNQTLTLHIHNFTGDRKFRCYICDKRFRFNGQLHKHLVGVHNEKHFKSKGLVGCRDCGRLFINIRILFRHRNAFHASKKTWKSASPPRKVADRKNAGKKPIKSSTRSLVSPQPSSTPPPQLSPPVLVKQEVIPQEDQTGEVEESPQIHKIDYGKQRLGFFCCCGHKAKCDKTLRRHITYYTAPDQFRCEVCPDRSFKSTSRLRAHMKGVHEMDYEHKGCRHCGQLFATMEELKEHQQCVHKVLRRKRKAEEIDLTAEDDNVPSSTTARMSTRSFGSSTLFSSPIKPKPTTSQKIPPITRKKHGIDLSKRNLGHYCICGINTSRFTSLNNHINYFTAEWKFPCQLCDKRFLHLSRLREHLVAKHKEADLKEIDSMGKGCAECGQTGFRTFGELLHHRKAMHIQSPVKQTTRVMAAMCSPSPPKLYPQTTLPSYKVPPPNFAAAISPGQITPPPLQPQNNQHGIDLSKKRDEHFCHCGDRFPDEDSLRSHILCHVQSPRDNSPPSTSTFEPLRVPARSPAFMRPVPPKKDAEIHRVIRVGKLSNVKVCYCGRQFNSEQLLQDHVRSFPTNQQEPTSSKQGEGSPPPPSNPTRRSLVPPPQQAPPYSGPSIVIQTGQSVEPPEAAAARTLRSTTPSPEEPSSDSDSDSDSDSQDAPVNSWDLKHETDNTIQDGLFYCTCGKCFHTKSQLNTHLQWFNMERRFACNFCGNRFLGIGYLKTHLKQSHDMDYTHLDLIGCRHCGEVLTSRPDFIQHRAEKHPRIKSGKQKAVNGSISQSSTPEPSTAPSISIRLGPQTVPDTTVSTPIEGTSSQQHPSLPPPPQEYFDDDDMIVDAHLSFEPYEAVVQHQIDHSKAIYGYFCVCGTECGNKHSLAKHVRYYSADRKFVCKTCGLGFLGPGLLRNHMLKVHKIVYNISNGCKECGKSFITNMELYHHFRMEHNNGSQWEPREMKYVPPTPLNENQNGIAAPANNAEDTDDVREEHGILSEGPLREGNDLWFVCKCKKKYSSRAALLTHIRTLAAGKIFKCHLCGYRFNTHGNLKGHVTNVHGVVYDKGRYACGRCATTFETCEEMKIHRRTVHEQNR